MKQVVFIFVFLAVVYAAAFSAGKTRWFQLVQTQTSTAEVVDLGFRPTSYPLQERPFVCVVIGYNNGAFVEKTLRSIFSQVYFTFRIIYIDDASEDGSFALVKDLVEASGSKDRVTLVQHTQHEGQLASLCEGVRECADEEIVVWIDGNDWLAHEWVLSSLNSYYADPDLWVTYGQYREFPDYKLGISAPFSDKDFRVHPFVASHLKTFYAGLFKRIDPVDFTYQGTFLTAGVDFAVMIPLLELAQHHFQYVPQVLYIANRQAALKEDEELALKAHRYLRSMASYDPLSHFAQPEEYHE